MLVEIRVFKSAGGTSTDREWSNVYHSNVDGEITGPELSGLVGNIVALEQKLHLTNTFFLRAVVSTVAKEGPGHPEAVKSFGLDAKGLRAADVVGAYALQAVLQVDFQGEFGRAGKKYYRNCLVEADVSVTAGNAALVGDFPLEAKGAFDTFAGIAGRPPLVILGADEANEEAAREVTSFKVKGVNFRSMRRRKKK